MDIENGPKTTITARELLSMMRASKIENSGLIQCSASMDARGRLNLRRPQNVSRDWPFDADEHARFFAAEWLKELAIALGGVTGAEPSYTDSDSTKLVLKVAALARLLGFDVDSKDGVERFTATYAKAALDQALASATDRRAFRSAAIPCEELARLFGVSINMSRGKLHVLDCDGKPLAYEHVRALGELSASALRRRGLDVPPTAQEAMLRIAVVVRTERSGAQEKGIAGREAAHR